MVFQFPIWSKISNKLTVRKEGKLYKNILLGKSKHFCYIFTIGSIIVILIKVVSYSTIRDILENDIKCTVIREISKTKGIS